MLYADPCHHVLCSLWQVRSGLRLILGLLSLALSVYTQVMFAPSPFAPPLVKTIHDNLIPSRSPDPLTCLSHLDDSVIHLFNLDDDFDDDYGVNIVANNSIPSKSLAYSALIFLLWMLVLSTWMTIMAWMPSMRSQFLASPLQSALVSMTLTVPQPAGLDDSGLSLSPSYDSVPFDLD